jgi:hypothetical protein
VTCANISEFQTGAGAWSGGGRARGPAKSKKNAKSPAARATEIAECIQYRTKRARAVTVGREAHACLLGAPPAAAAPGRRAGASPSPLSGREDLVASSPARTRVTLSNQASSAAAYSSLNSAAPFSMKAFIPIFWSAVANDE